MKPAAIFTALLAVVPTALAAPSYGSTGAALDGYDASHENFCSAHKLYCCKDLLNRPVHKGFEIGGMNRCDLLETAAKLGFHTDSMIGGYAGTDKSPSLTFGFCEPGDYAVCCATRVDFFNEQAIDCNYAEKVPAPSASRATLPHEDMLHKDPRRV